MKTNSRNLCRVFVCIVVRMTCAGNAAYDGELIMTV
jgi:hypothetical protein